MGADVVKVESPEGDLMRSRPVQRDGAGTMSALNAASARSCSTSSDPRPSRRSRNSRPGRRRARELPARRHEAAGHRLSRTGPGQSPSRLLRDLGYGQTGPAAGRPAYAPVIHCLDGYDMAHAVLTARPRAAGHCGIFVADYASGSYAMGAILAALYQRNATGQGQMVDVSMFETLVGMLLGEVNRAQFDFEIPSRPMYGPIEAKDGYVMLATASERTFQDMATAAGRRDWLTDPRFEKYADRRMNWAEFVDEFEQWSGSSRSRNAWRRWRSMACPAALSHRDRGAADPQVAHRGSLCTIETAPALQVAAPLPLLRLSPAKRPQGRRSRRTHQERPRRSGPQRSGGRGAAEMIDPRTAILVGCGQITDLAASLRASARGLPLREAARVALADTGASIGARRARPTDRHAGRLEFFSDISPALRLAVRPFEQSAQSRRQSRGRRAAATFIQPLRRQHAPIPGETASPRRSRTAETELALICGAELCAVPRTRAAPAKRSIGKRIPAGSRSGSATSVLASSDEEARHELRRAIHFYPLLENAIARRPEARRRQPR